VSPLHQPRDGTCVHGGRDHKMATTEQPRRLIATIERAMDVLLLFTRADSPTLGVTEIATELGQSKAAVHRVLTTLASRGFVESDSNHRYRLGRAVLSLGQTFIDRVDLREVIAPHLKELSEQTQETATMSLRNGWTRFYVDQVVPPREVLMTVQVGQEFPLYAGSSSKVLLAFMSEEERDRYLADLTLVPLTERTITDVDQLRAELEVVRSQWYSTSFGERQAGAASVASAVLDHTGAPVASISVCGPMERLRAELGGIADLVVRAAGDITHQLGYEDGYLSDRAPSAPLRDSG